MSAVKKCQATEAISYDDAQALVSLSATWTSTVLNRLRHSFHQDFKTILEIGSAQSRSLVQLSKLGYSAYGLEPNYQAIQIGKKIAQDNAVSVNVVSAVGEFIPYANEKFDVVLAFAVMEHVQNLEGVLCEIYRVLKPGGIFWFSSASSMCPKQNEISGFPLFGWYPDTLKRKIMSWAVHHQPSLIGYTQHPAINWWTPFNTKKRLERAGFMNVRDRWDLRYLSEEKSIFRIILSLLKRIKLTRYLADILVPGCSYAALKPADK